MNPSPAATRPTRKLLIRLILGCIVLLLSVLGLLVMLGPVIGERFSTEAGGRYCVQFFHDTNRNAVQDESEQRMVIPAALMNEIHGAEVYATYPADQCAPMRSVNFDVEVVLPPGYEVTTFQRQNIGGRYDDRLYTFKFGVQEQP